MPQSSRSSTAQSCAAWDGNPWTANPSGIGLYNSKKMESLLHLSCDIPPIEQELKMEEYFDIAWSAWRICRAPLEQLLRNTELEHSLYLVLGFTLFLQSSISFDE